MLDTLNVGAQTRDHPWMSLLCSRSHVSGTRPNTIRGTYLDGPKEPRLDDPTVSNGRAPLSPSWTALKCQLDDPKGPAPERLAVARKHAPPSSESALGGFAL
jgi:hypothetical protein